MDFDLLAEAFPQIAAGIPTTLALVGISLVLGFALAVGTALMRLSSNKIASGTAYGFVYVFRGTPLLIQMFIIYYGSGQFRPFLQEIGLWVFFREPWFCAILAFMLNTGAYTSEIIRGGIQSVPLGQLEAGRAVGMSGVQLFRRVTFPQAIRQALPGYGNEIMLMVKSSSLASTITILEITGVARKIMAATFRPVEVFVIAGSIYLLINFLVSRGIAFTEHRLSTSSAKRLRATASPAQQ